MAEIDASIPLSVKPYQAADVVGDIGRAYQLKDLVQKSDAQQYALESQKKIRDIASTSDISTPEGQQEFIQKVSKVDPSLAAEYGQNFAKQGKERADTQNVNYEILGKKNEIVTSAALNLSQQYDALIAKGVPDAQARQQLEPVKMQLAAQLQQMKLPDGSPVLGQHDIENLQKPFDPQAIKGFAMQGMKMKDVLQQKLEEQRIGIERGRLGEETRHHKAEEAAAAAKLKAQQDGFNEESSDLMASLAEKGVSLPAGFRSKAQQISLLHGLLRRNPGKSADEIADMVKTGQIEFGAEKKETTVAAGQAGKVEVAENEIQEFAPLVKQASAKVPRGSFVPINKLLQMADSSISDPNLKQLKIYINSMMNAYDQLAARGGTDKEKRAESRALLTSADSAEALDSAIDAFEREAAAAHRAAVKATKVPELPEKSGKGGKSVHWDDLP